jgi:hypothetical protein
VAKPKVAFYWNASCGGCEEAVVDLAEDILMVADAVEIVLWPVAMDFKRKDIEAMKDGEIAVAFLNGAVRTSEQEDWSKLLRRKSQIMIAFGACAHLGGVPGLANFSDRAGVFDASYLTAVSNDNPDGVTPQLKTEMPDGDLGHGPLTRPGRRRRLLPARMRPARRSHPRGGQGDPRRRASSEGLCPGARQVALRHVRQERQQA